MWRIKHPEEPITFFNRRRTSARYIVVVATDRAPVTRR